MPGGAKIAKQLLALLESLTPKQLASFLKPATKQALGPQLSRRGRSEDLANMMSRVPSELMEDKQVLSAIPQLKDIGINRFRGLLGKHQRTDVPGAAGRLEYDMPLQRYLQGEDIKVNPKSMGQGYYFGADVSNSAVDPSFYKALKILMREGF